MLHAHEPTIRITTYEVGIIIMLVDVGRTRQPGVRGLAQGPPDEWGHLNLVQSLRSFLDVLLRGL